MHELRVKDGLYCVIMRVDKECTGYDSTNEINKIALSADDDKREIMDDGVHTLAYGHYSLRTTLDEY